MRTCSFCGEPVNPDSRTVWRRIEGWERKATDPSRRSGSDIALRQARDQYACNRCIDKQKHGLAAGQQALV